MYTFETVIAGVAYGCTDHGFEVEEAAQRPRITIEDTERHEVALPTFVPDGLVETKGEFDATHVVVAVNDVGSKKMMHVDGVCPVADRWREQQMAELAGRDIVRRPGTVACRHAYRPMWCHTESDTQIRGEHAIVQQVVADRNDLCINIS